MAGVTDWAFRTICARMGAGLTVTEMVSSRALVYRDRKSAGLLRKNEGSVVGAQIFGNDPEVMPRGQLWPWRFPAVTSLTSTWAVPWQGWSVTATARSHEGHSSGRPDCGSRGHAVPVPVTVKCRLGWDRGSINVVELAQAVEAAGAQAIAVHGRTRTMLYSGVADWDTIRKVKAAVSIPVIANGDVFSGEAALQCQKRTGADLIMLGRGVFGDPWLFQEVAAALAGQATPPRPPLASRVDTAVEQFRLAEQDKGEHIACLEARKHFAWYLRGVPYSGYYKEKISHISTMADILDIAAGVKRDLR